MGNASAKIAIVGAGLIGKTHIKLVERHAELFAIIDPAQAAPDLASEIGVPWFPNLTDCLSFGRPDGVIVASPNGLHYEHALTCLEAGIPVLVEKPLTDTVNAGRSLVDSARATGTPLLVGHHRRHSPVIKAAREVMASARLGRLVSVNAMFWLHKPEAYFNVAWRTQDGAGPTYINLIHDIDLLQHLCGPITHVQARESNGVRGFDVEDTSAMIVTFANGALGTISVSDTVSAPWSWELTSGENPAYPETNQSCYMLGGTAGALSLPDLRVWSHKGEQSWWSPMDCDEISKAKKDPVEVQLLHFLDVIAGTATPLVSAEDGLRNIEVLEAVKRAAKSGGVEATTPLA